MDVLRFVLIGLGAGGLYALIAQGLVLVYRGSGVLNFGQGAFVMVGGFTYFQCTSVWGLPLIVGLVAAAVVGGLVGALVQVLVMRNMTRSTALLRVIATLAVMMVLQALAVLLFGVELNSAPSLLPTAPVEVLSGVSVGADRLILLGIGALTTLVLWYIYRSTTFGRATGAVAENQRVAASLGHSPERIALINWSLGGALSGVAGALIAPITYLQPTTLALLVIPALAVGLIANFSSFPMVFAAALGLGVVEALTARYITTPGWSQSVPFLIVIVVMVVRGRGIPLRSHVLERLADVGSGRIRPIPVAALFVVLAALMLFVLPSVWVSAFTVTIGFSILCLSVVLVTGYAGQLSLAQYVLAGVGALLAAQLAVQLGLPFPLAVVGAVVLTALLGLLVALPALRTRGINLAVVTLGLGVVLFNVVLNNTDYSGGTSGIPVPDITLFGLDVSGLVYPERYGVVSAIVLFLVALALLNVRRGRAGRRMLAVRSNERASAALGISVFGVKLFAFAAGAGIAALAGVVLAFRSASVVALQFDSFQSITTVAMTVIGGVGFVGGGIMGSTLMPAGVGSEVLHRIAGLDTWLPLISGLLLLVILVREPSGLWAMNVEAVRGLVAKLRRAPTQADEAEQAAPAEVTARSVSDLPVRRVEPRELRVDGVRVRFGGVVAVADASFVVQPGQVHGLIGPNGAGKTTVIDAASGFVRADAGRITLAGKDITSASPQRRVRAGLGRSFQSVELFEDLTVRENLAIAADRWSTLRYLSDFVVPGRLALPPIAEAAAREFHLVDDLDRKPRELPMGRRRLAAIARAVAAAPSVLCLDEPAAGLSDQEADDLGVLLRRLAEEWGMGILLVEHNIDMVIATCDVVTVLAGGSVLVSGEPQEVRHDPRVLEAYLGTSTDDVEAAALITETTS